jgi:hypothetical protein
VADPHVVDDLGAYALDALEPAEREHVEAHVAACAVCRTLLGDYLSVTDGLRLAVAPAQPAAAGWQAIAARLDHGRPSRLAWLPSRGTLLRLAVAAAFAGLVAWNAWLQWAPEAASGDSDNGAEVESVVRLWGADPRAGWLYVSHDESLGGLTLSGMPPGAEYEVWFIRHDQTRQSGGTFVADTLGLVVVEVRMPDTLGDFDGVAISRTGEGEKYLLSGPLYDDQ